MGGGNKSSGKVAGVTVLTLTLAVWGVLTIIFVVTEFFTNDLSSLFVGSGTFAGFASALVGWPFVVQAVVAAGVALLGVFIIRPYLKKHRTDVPLTKMNADAYPGERAVVVETVTESSGLVKFRGAPWSARLLPAFAHEGDIPPGQKVRVEQVDGAFLLVSRTEFDTPGK